MILFISWFVLFILSCAGLTIVTLYLHWKKLHVFYKIIFTLYVIALLAFAYDIIKNNFNQL